MPILVLYDRTFFCYHNRKGLDLAVSDLFTAAEDRGRVSATSLPSKIILPQKLRIRALRNLQQQCHQPIISDFAYRCVFVCHVGWRNKGVIVWLHMAVADHRSISPYASALLMFTFLITGCFTMDRHPLVNLQLRALIHFVNCTCQSCSQSRGIAYSSWPTKTESTSSRTSQTKVRNMKGNGVP